MNISSLPNQKKNWIHGFENVCLKIVNFLRNESGGKQVMVRLLICNWCANDNQANLMAISDFSSIDTMLKVLDFVTNNTKWNTTKLQPLVVVTLL